MPTYVYKFLDTGETIEVQQSFNDPTLTEAAHPVTGHTMPVKKVFLPVGVTFKGGGFYKTDSRNGSSKSTASSSGSGDGAASSSGDSSSSTTTKSETAPSAGAAASTKSDSSSSTP
jgi:predicted nucleic acid-binding Zn ribbon protein